MCIYAVLKEKDICKKKKNKGYSGKRDLIYLYDKVVIIRRYNNRFLE